MKLDISICGIDASQMCQKLKQTRHQQWMKQNATSKWGGLHASGLICCSSSCTSSQVGYSLIQPHNSGFKHVRNYVGRIELSIASNLKAGHLARYFICRNAPYADTRENFILSHTTRKLFDVMKACAQPSAAAAKTIRIMVKCYSYFLLIAISFF